MRKEGKKSLIANRLEGEFTTVSTKENLDIQTNIDNTRTDTYIEYIQTSTLQPHPKSIEIYQDEPDESLIDSIKKHGILQPIATTQDLIIVSGHRRWQAAQSLKIDKVPIIREMFSDPLNILEAIVETNRYRIKTDAQIAREAKVLYDVEQQRAEQRMKSGKKTTDSNFQSAPQQPTQKGETKEIVSKKVGASQKKVDLGAKVAQLVDTLKEYELTDEAETLNNELNTRGINPAWDLAREFGWNKLLVKDTKKRDKAAQQIIDESDELKNELEYKASQERVKSVNKLMQEIITRLEKLHDFDVDPYWINANAEKAVDLKDLCLATYDELEALYRDQ